MSNVTSPREVVERIDELLELRYRSADLGNFEDPLDEAVYILISQQTRDLVYRRTYFALRQRYPEWHRLLGAPGAEIEGILRPAGFQTRRTNQLLALLTAVSSMNQELGAGPFGDPPGDLTLDFLRGWPDEAAERYLRGLPGMGPKSARCIMAYSLGRQTFAVDTHVHRIFTRLGILPSRGRKADQDPFQEIVPRSMRKRLHVNLVHHGRAVCRSQAERCHDCVLVSFCARGRDAVAADGGRPVAVDLFAGAGGMGSGFEDAGFRIGLAIERERHPAQTYRLNHPGVPVLEAEIDAGLTARRLRKFAPALRDVDAVIGGPPCQGYSAATTRDRRADDPRNHLYRHAARLARELRARVVAIENVPGARSVRGHRFVERIESELHAAGFSVKAHLLRATDFGVPQRRVRYFFLGVRGRGDPPAHPEPTHAARVDPAPGTEASPPTPTVIDTLNRVPTVDAGYRERWLSIAEGLDVANAETMRHSKDVIAKIKSIEPGKGPISYRRLELEEARTIIAGHRALPVHPRANRTLSVREAALLQGFPLDYTFCGPSAEQPLQVANAVPPAVAAGVGRVLRSLLRNKQQ